MKPLALALVVTTPAALAAQPLAAPAIKVATFDVDATPLARVAGTTPDRVAVHALHQHDAPGCGLTAERLVRDLGLMDFGRFDSDFHRDVMGRAAAAIEGALKSAQPATQYGFGVAEVKGVASNRRILGPDGKVRAVRYTATTDAALRAEPEGVPSPDFPGIARFIRGRAVPEALHVHFNGAGGNVGAGKYNDGDKENRLVLAQRLADGMKRALAETKNSRWPPRTSAGTRSRSSSPSPPT